MAIDRVPSTPNAHPVTEAFELLADDYGALSALRDEARIPADEFDALLVIRHTFSLWDFLNRHREEFYRACDLRFSINILPELLLNNELYQRINDDCLSDISETHLVFELDTTALDRYVGSGTGRGNRIDAIASVICTSLRFKIGIDDEGAGAARHSVITRLRRACGEKVAWRKLDWYAFQNQFVDDAEELKDILSEFCGPGHYGIIEGIQNDTHWRYIADLAREKSTIAFFAQGFYVKGQSLYRTITGND